MALQLIVSKKIMLFNHQLKSKNIFFFYKYSYYHRKTGIKVYSSDIITDVYGSDQSRVKAHDIFTTKFFFVLCLGV